MKNGMKDNSLVYRRSKSCFENVLAALAMGERRKGQKRANKSYKDRPWEHGVTDGPTETALAMGSQGL
jgi:hypothetical protein